MGDRDQVMVQEVVTEGAPKAIGPYSQGVKVGEWVLVSGQIPLDPVTGKLVEGDAGVQMERVLENVGAILAEAGVGFGDVVKTTLYLMDLQDFSVINGVYARYFRPPYPARATVGVAALPGGARLAMEVMARWSKGNGDG